MARLRSPLSEGLSWLAMNYPDRYSRTAILLHWVLVALLAAQIGFGWFLEDVARGTPERAIYVNLHKSTGMLIGLLILFRLYWRLSHRPPALPASLPAWEKAVASSSHVLLYAAMVIMPLSGYIASNFSQYGVNFFNRIKLPPWGVEDSNIYAFFNGMHDITAGVLVALIVLHVLAALRHLLKKDGTFSRIWPAGGGAGS
jgi:cytochrome b561